jgi:hypothetical protein
VQAHGFAVGEALSCSFKGSSKSEALLLQKTYGFLKEFKNRRFIKKNVVFFEENVVFFDNRRFLKGATKIVYFCNGGFFTVLCTVKKKRKPVQKPKVFERRTRDLTFLLCKKWTSFFF